MQANIVILRNSCGVAMRRELEFRRSFEPPPPAQPQSSGDGRGYDHVRHLRGRSPALVVEGLPGRAQRSCCSKRQKIFLHFKLRNSLNCLLVHIIQAEFALILAAFCIAGCIYESEMFGHRILRVSETRIIHCSDSDIPNCVEIIMIL